MVIRPYQIEDEQHVIQLWRICDLVKPENDPKNEIDTKMRFQPDLFFVGVYDTKIIGTIMVGYEGHRGWINYLAIHPLYQQRGFGKKLMEYATKQLTELGCQKINIQIRKSNLSVIEFYKKLGFTDDDEYWKKTLKC